VQDGEDGVEGEQGREGVDGGVLEGLVRGEEREGDRQEQAWGLVRGYIRLQVATYDMNSAIMATDQERLMLGRAEAPRGQRRERLFYGWKPEMWLRQQIRDLARVKERQR
jgi:hypothetical protein